MHSVLSLTGPQLLQGSLFQEHLQIISCHWYLRPLPAVQLAGHRLHCMGEAGVSGEWSIRGAIAAAARRCWSRCGERMASGAPAPKRDNCSLGGSALRLVCCRDTVCSPQPARSPGSCWGGASTLTALSAAETGLRRNTFIAVSAAHRQHKSLPWVTVPHPMGNYT